MSWPLRAFWTILFAIWLAGLLIVLLGGGD